MKFLFSIALCISAFSMVGQSVDTNYTDKDNLKQGYWRILGKDKKVLQDYRRDQLIDEGNYVNSRKQGLWLRYYPNGNIKSKITYVNSRPRGLYETYYENGFPEEKGIWKDNRNEYFEHWDYGADGCLLEWKCHRNQTITEIKKYVTCNCLLYEIIIDTITGLAVKKEYENGKLMETKPYTLEMEKAFNDSIALYKGLFKEVSFEWNSDYYSKSRKTRKRMSNSSYNQIALNDNFSGEGKFILYNNYGQMLKDGVFKRYRLMDGKKYLYDEKGVLILIQQYKNGRYYSDLPIEKNK